MLGLVLFSCMTKIVLRKNNLVLCLLVEFEKSFVLFLLDPNEMVKRGKKRSSWDGYCAGCLGQLER